MSAPSQSETWRTVGRLVGPGMYLHRNELHVDAEQVCAHFGVPCTEENFNTLMSGVLQAAAEHGIPRIDVMDGPA